MSVHLALTFVVARECQNGGAVNEGHRCHHLIRCHVVLYALE
jgi:hypothetical protein